jgi:membrane protein YdbS with pleckstrin-like domain
VRSRLRAGETLRLVTRRHPIAILGPLALLLFFFGALCAALLSRSRNWQIAAGTVFAAVLLWALWRWLEWRADLWAVTSQRVIDESGVLTVRMVDSPLETIHNVACEQSLFGRMLGFGTITIQTAAQHGEQTIEGLARPEELRDAILEMKELRRSA